MNFFVSVFVVTVGSIAGLEAVAAGIMTGSGWLVIAGVVTIIAAWRWMIREAQEDSDREVQKLRKELEDWSNNRRDQLNKRS